MAKYYLDEDGVRILVKNFNNNLELKVDKQELNNYATKQDIQNIDTDLSNYATQSYVNQQIAAIPEVEQYDDTILKNRITALEGKTTGIYHWKGSVANLEALEAIQNPEIGDVYNLEDTGMNAGWTGSEWDDFGTIVDLSEYIKNKDIQEISRNELNAILFNNSRKAVISDVESFSAIILNNQPKVEIILNNDLIFEEPFIIPEGKEVIIKLDNNNISSGNENAIIAKGIGSKLILEGNGTISSSANGTIIAQAGGEIILNSADIISTKSNCISAKGIGSKVTINNGSVTGQEYGVIVTYGGSAEINGGILKGIDNFALGGNGSAGMAPDTVTINGGRLEGHIQSDGYIATAIYWPNEGTLNINGGEIISDGTGIVQRGGTVNIGSNAVIKANGITGAQGKAGDSKILVGSYAIVFDKESNYPGSTDMKLNIANGATLIGTDGSLQKLPNDASGIIDNR